MEQLRQFYRRHAAFIRVLLLFVSFRLLAILTLRTGGFVADFSDYDFYATWGQLTHMGYRTFENLWTAYPPLFAAVMLPVFELSSRIPPWIEPRFWFHLLFGLTLLLFETGNLVLIYRLGAKLDREESPPVDDAGAFTRIPGLTAAMFYALLFVPAYTLLGWFEAMPLFFMLLGLDLLLSARPGGWIASAIAAALGFLTKLTPMLLVPIAVRWLGAKLSWPAARNEWFNRRSPGNLLRPTAYVLIFAGVIAGLGYLLVGGRLELAFSSFTINSIRPPWQSIWAVIDGFYGYGLVPLDMRNLTKLDQSLWETRLPWVWITLAFLALYLWLYTRPYDWSRRRTPVVYAAISILWLFLYSKGWSPQFLVWVLAFIVLLKPDLLGLSLAVILSIINVVEAYIFLIMLPDAHWIMNGTVIARTILLLLLAVILLAQIWPRPRRAAQLTRLSGATAWATLAAIVLVALLALPRAAHAYQARRLAEDPCREAIAFLQAEAADGIAPTATILTEEIPLWQSFYPWLHADYAIHVLDFYSPTDEAPAMVLARRLDELLTDGEVWWLESRPPQLAATFARPDLQRLEEQSLGACTVARLLALPDEQVVATATVAGGPIQLRHISLSPAQVGQELDVVLYWQADSPVDGGYTVFTQLFDDTGQLVAQQDNVPVRGLAPTDTWQPGTLIRDPYALIVPSDVDAGTYRLHIGLYDAEGRQLWRSADDGAVSGADSGVDGLVGLGSTSQDHLELLVPVAASAR